VSDAPGDFTLNGISTAGLSRLTGRFRNATQSLHDRLLGIITEEVGLIADNARARMAELFKNPSIMQRSVGTSVEDGGTFIYGTVFAAGLPYLRIQEYGGTIMTPEIFPSTARALHFFANRSTGFRPGAEASTNEVFTKSTRAHPTRIPERSYMRYALAQRRAAIRARFAQAASDSMSPDA
jgi:hypothetical protein